MTVTRGLAVGAVLSLLAGCGAASSLPGAGSGSSGAGGGPVGAGGAGGAPSSDPLVGTWVGTGNNNPGEMQTDTLTLEADGTATTTIAVTTVGGATCSGSIQFTGLTWSATMSELVLTSGPALACTGGEQCSNGEEFPCPNPPTLSTPPCNYTLSNGNDTLVTTCMGQSQTWTREN